MADTYEIRRLEALLVFDLEDGFARERGTRGPHPRPFGTLRFFFTARDIGAGQQDFTPPLELLVRRNPAGYHLFFGLTRRPNGTVHRGALPAGTYAVRVEGDFYQPAERDDIVLPTPRRAFRMDLRPGHLYPFPSVSSLGGGRGMTLLRGSIHRTGGEPVAGAGVEVVGVTSVYQTDAAGQWVLVFPDTQPTGTVSVRVTMPEGAVVNVAGVGVAQGGERSLPETALRGWVLTAAGVGVPGATVNVLGRPGAARTGEDGGWFYYFGLTQPDAVVTLRATLPTGQTLTAGTVHVRRRATLVVPPFRFP